MKAVNLVPSADRSRQARLSTSPQMLAAVAGLAFILVATVLYVSAANTVSSSQRELAQVTAGATSWTASAKTYLPLVQAAQRHSQELAAIQQLATSRFPWSRLLGQISGLMPTAAALSSLQATTTSTTGTSPASPPAVQLAGCADSQSTVAQTMVQLHRISGVSAVTLATSTDTAASAGGSGGSTSSAAVPGASGVCPFPVSFQVTLTFAASSAAGATSSGATTSSAPPTSATGAAQ